MLGQSRPTFWNMKLAFPVQLFEEHGVKFSRCISESIAIQVYLCPSSVGNWVTETANVKIVASNLEMQYYINSHWTLSVALEVTLFICTWKLFSVHKTQWGYSKPIHRCLKFLHIEVWGYLKHMCRCLHCKVQEQVCAHPICVSCWKTGLP